ncbi:BRI1-like 3 [Hibiscus trionum]|uniref:BRI1-like 3 n=1 Tax=Hibiscus trionum TaxID=183268 RepID=A0A9W7JEL0_HIBTR|nr:BRI1-like 3 [Hibiscus trionum]
MGNFWVFQNQCMCLFSCFIFTFLHNSFTLSLQQQNPSNEVMAMLGFKQKSVAADPQGFLNDWRLESLTPCSWRGVSCSSHGNVTMLNFTDAGLIGRLHMDDLMVLESLKHLHLSGNLFSGNFFLNKASHPSCIIETLDLSFNNLSEPISETFLGSCFHLVSLNLSHNSIPGDIPAVLVSDFSKSLKSLDLSHNNLSDDFPMLEFKNCANLVALNLSNNSLYGTGIPRSLTNCLLLENLDVSLNKVEGKIPASLGNLKNLKHLNLAQNTISGNIPPEMGSTCGTLTELDLSGNKLSGGFPETFKSCNGLQRLNLGSNQLSGNFLTTVISYLPSLQILQVPFNNISGFIPLSLTNCT